MINSTYHAFVAADDQWHAELVRVFGREAGDARYDKRGVSTEKLKSLYDERQEARLAWTRAQFWADDDEDS